MRLILIASLALIGCGSSNRAEENLGPERPWPTLVTLETDDGDVELRGVPKLRALEGQDYFELSISADDAELRHVAFTVRLKEIPGSWSGISHVAYGEGDVMADPALWHDGKGPVTVNVSEGRAYGTFEAVFPDGQTRKGRFDSNRISLSCFSKGARGVVSEDPNVLGGDEELSSEFCQGVVKALRD